MLLDFLKKEKAKQNSDSNVAEDFFPFKIKKNTSKNKQRLTARKCFHKLLEKEKYFFKVPVTQEHNDHISN